jgi:hypothetical protein
MIEFAKWNLWYNYGTPTIYIASYPLVTRLSPTLSDPLN